MLLISSKKSLQIKISKKKFRIEPRTKFSRGGGIHENYSPLTWSGVEGVMWRPLLKFPLEVKIFLKLANQIIGTRSCPTFFSMEMNVPPQIPREGDLSPIFKGGVPPSPLQPSLNKFLDE